MSSSNNTEIFCRYFSSGMCRQGDRCIYSHDRSSRSENVCRYYLKGSCNYGTACRYDHIRPKKRESSAKSSTTVPIPKPVKLPPPGLNTGAAEFVPRKKITAGTSYSQAAGAVFVEKDIEKNIPLCPYFEMGECTKVDCKFVHGNLCELCSKYCLHPYNYEQQRQHFEECSKFHEIAMEEAFAEARSAGKCCGICMENIREKSLRFGILNGCRHCFCLECIRSWRKNQGFETKVVRSCPECRQHSDFVIPSTIWIEDENEKQVLLELYKENTGQKQCKYYINRTAGSGCPFGNKCFYKHQLPDGSIDPGESPHVRRRPLLSEFIFRMDSDESGDDNDDYFQQVLHAITANFNNHSVQ